MKQRLFFDVNSGVGRLNKREDKIPFKPDDLLYEMEYYRVHASLIYSNMSKHYSFVKGNRELLENINGNSRLFGAATVIPGIQYELDEGFDYYNRLLDKGIKAFKIYPKSMSFSFDPFTMEELIEYMIQRDVPLIADIEEIDWTSLGIMLNTFRSLKLSKNTQRFS